MTLTSPVAASVLCVQHGTCLRALLDQSSEEYRFVFAKNAFEALREVNRWLFDAYILDYWLPDLRGVQLSREICKVDPSARILFWGAAVSEQEQLRAFRAGASACLPEAVDASQLQRHLRVLREAAALHTPRAKAEAQVAVHDELTGRVSELLRRNGLAPEAARRAIERSAKKKAARAFVTRGGTLACFERAWPAMFADAWRTYTFV